MNISQSTLALKEWDAIIRATCHHRAQTVLFRKGGILDTQFESNILHHDDLLYFFPTSFHAHPGLLQPEWASRVTSDVTFKTLTNIPIEYACRITGAWHCSDPCIGEHLKEFHIYGPEFMKKRLGYREDHPVCVLEVEPFRLQEPLLVPNSKDLWGCFSWIPLDNIIAASEGYQSYVQSHSTEEIVVVPCYDNPQDFAVKQEKLRQCLSRETISSRIASLL